MICKSVCIQVVQLSYPIFLIFETLISVFVL